MRIDWVWIKVHGPTIKPSEIDHARLIHGDAPALVLADSANCRAPNEVAVRAQFQGEDVGAPGRCTGLHSRTWVEIYGAPERPCRVDATQGVHGQPHNGGVCGALDRFRPDERSCSAELGNVPPAGRQSLRTVAWVKVRQPNEVPGDIRIPSGIHRHVTGNTETVACGIADAESGVEIRGKNLTIAPRTKPAMLHLQWRYLATHLRQIEIHSFLTACKCHYFCRRHPRRSCSPSSRQPSFDIRWRTSSRTIIIKPSREFFNLW
jgi:hypothetical protein